MILETGDGTNLITELIRDEYCPVNGSGIGVCMILLPHTSHGPSKWLWEVHEIYVSSHAGTVPSQWGLEKRFKGTSVALKMPSPSLATVTA